MSRTSVSDAPRASRRAEDPCQVDGRDDEHGTSELLRRGVAVPPRTPLDVERFLGVPVARLTEGAGVSEIIVAERGARG